MTMPEQATRPTKIAMTAQKYYDELSAWYARQSPQDVAAYNPLGGTDAQACANCLFFMSPNQCTVVESYPVAISPTGLSKFWTAIPVYRPEPMEVIIVDRAEVEEKAAQDGFLGRMLAAVKDLFVYEREKVKGSRQEVIKALSEPSGLQVFKDTDGSWRWFAWVSNKWRDRDGEIIEDKAHRDFVAYLDEGGEMPEAWLWHTPGTRWGKADWADYADGFLTMSGTVDAGSEYVAEALAKEAVGVSHGFQLTYSAKDVIGWYRSFEISALPPSAAANVWTSLELVRKEVAAMSFSAAKRQYLETKIGRDKTDELERSTGALSKSLADLGVDYKDVPEDVAPATLSEKQLSEVADAMVKAFAESPAIKALADGVAAVSASAEQTAAGLKALGERITVMEKTDGEKVADYFTARTSAAGVQRASQSTKTLLTEDERKETESASPAFEWLEKAL